MGADAEKYAQWIVDNKDKKGTPDFEKVSKAYQVAKTQSVPKPSIWDDTPLSDENINNLYEGFGAVVNNNCSHNIHWSVSVAIGQIVSEAISAQLACVEGTCYYWYQAG